MQDHLVHFYEPGGSSLVENVAHFLSGALREGGVALVAAPAERMNAIHDDMEKRGVDCREAVKRGRLEFVDAHDALEAIIYGGTVDAQAFDAVIGERVRDMLARRHAPALHVYGELVGVLWKDGNEAGAVELERLWNELGDGVPLHLYCGYPLDGFDQRVWSANMEAVLSAHTASIPEKLAS